MKQKTRFLKTLVIVMGVVLITVSCKKDKEEETPTGSVPTLTTVNVNSITQTSAACGGEISSDGGSTVTARGVCWSTGQTPTISDSKTVDGTGAGTFVSNMTGLNTNTTYYVRAYATNANGTGYGSAMSFSTQAVTDIDGNVYTTIVIGTQTWMVENLKVTKLNDGTPIPLVTNNSSWGILTTSGYCWYNNDQNTYKNTYGALYNWYAVNTGKLCPQGWHVPTDAEWTTLVNYLGGTTVAGSKLKEVGTSHWNSPNDDATNESGFTALPGGRRYDLGTFGEVSFYGYWWSSTENDATYAWRYGLMYSFGDVDRYDMPKGSGYSVRCIKD